MKTAANISPTNATKPVKDASLGLGGKEASSVKADASSIHATSGYDDAVDVEVKHTFEHPEPASLMSSALLETSRLADWVIERPARASFPLLVFVAFFVWFMYAVWSGWHWDQMKWRPQAPPARLPTNDALIATSSMDGSPSASSESRAENRH